MVEREVNHNHREEVKLASSSLTCATISVKLQCSPMASWFGGISLVPFKGGKGSNLVTDKVGGCVQLSKNHNVHL